MCRTLFMLECKTLRVSSSAFRELRYRAELNPRLAQAMASGRIAAAPAKGRKLTRAQRERRKRRAAGQVTVEGFHGSNARFSRPDPKRGGSAAGHRAGGAGHWQTSDPWQARSYAKLASQRRGGRPTVLRSRARLHRALIYDAGGRPITEVKPNRAFSVMLADARRAGHDGVVFRNVRDAPGKLDHVRPATVAVAFHPQAVRTSARRRRR